MSNRLEKFIHDHRDQFDTEEPAPLVWKKLEQQLLPGKEQNNGKVLAMKILRWTAAAAIVVLAGVGIYSLVINKPADPATARHQDNSPATAPDDIIREINPSYAQEVYHFTQLIELKQQELEQLGKDNPDLYKQFMSDINKLDSSYNALKRELPNNPNREQLLEAMIQNLQLQTGLLNQQLQIIQKIKQEKNNSHETNSESI